MLRITIHLEAHDLTVLDALTKHFDHVEVAIDNPEMTAPTRQPHPVVAAVMDGERELTQRERDRRTRSNELAYKARHSGQSKRVVTAVACPQCNQPAGSPCMSPRGESYGIHGHTHVARQRAANELS